MEPQPGCVVVTGFGPFRQHLVNSSWEAVKLTVHVGVDAAAKAVVLEQRGRNRGYRETDVRGFRPENGVCVPDGPEVIESRVNMKAVSRHAAVEGVEVMFSRDAGRYVCDYTYYLSLHLGNGRAALIHVPPLSPGLPTSLLGKVLQVVIQEMLAEESLQRCSERMEAKAPQ
ncbi:PREDICTED: pyroglutamyl-peptidase 1-like protein [Myotis brandtii]|uniref:pyroglutamyl-peptidase 1-like protein n=1 Tax=Myotis brandtii TaxID=109478 RepID=UPI000703CA09|nr:PREDICTED: pyroglutamyl-peptidase 1-like protein [Myotis brandtii]